MERTILSRTVLMLGSLLFSTISWADEAYPKRPVEVIVAVSPGGSVDTVARMVAEQLGTALKQPFIISNRPGASGIIGTDFVAKSKADGYTLTMAPAAFISTNISLFSKLPYNPTRDFTPIANAVNSPRVLVVRSESPYKTVQDFITQAKAKPGKLSFGSAGEGTPHHLSAVLFEQKTGIEMMHVPYKGGAPATVDLLGGHIDMIFLSVPEALPHIRSGSLRALGVTNTKRATVLPNVPTMAEAGVKNMELNTWVGLLAPAGTPIDIIQKLNVAYANALTTGLGEKFNQMGYESVGGTPEEFSRLIQNDITLYADLIKASGMQPQ